LGLSTLESILEAARNSAQARGYGGLNFRDLASDVGIRAASIYHHFPSKAALGAAVARRYWEDTAADLESLVEQEPDPVVALRRYPEIFRRSLVRGNRLCLGSFMSAEYEGLPESVQAEVQTFADVNVAWIGGRLVEAGIVVHEDSDERAKAIFAAVSGAQLMARSRADIALFDMLIQSYSDVGLLPT
jgi:TetR/AcrR family transcriptional repressor of nem operon